MYNAGIVAAKTAFTFQYGEIKRLIEDRFPKVRILFTFQYGEIKSNGLVTVTNMQF